MKKVQYFISVFCPIYGTCFLGDEQTGQDIFTAYVLLIAAVWPVYMMMREEGEHKSRHDDKR